MAFVAQRGGASITLEELKGHLATLLRLEHLGVFLGAGASVGAGGQTIYQLWNAFKADYPESLAFLLSNNFISQANAVNGGVPPNIEVLGDSLEIASIEWHRGSYQEVYRQTIDLTINNLKRSVVKAAMLNAGWWTSPTATTLAPELGNHKRLLQKLTSARQPGQSSPWVFTTNYDLAIEWSAEAIDLQIVNGFTGIHNRRFSPQSFDLGLRNTLARGEARFGIYNTYLVKLHGSMTWQEVRGEITENAANAQWSSIDDFLEKRTNTTSMMVFPRAAKYMQTVGFAIGELLRRFSEFLVRPQTALLISGYGFGDEHLNRILLSALQNPTLQIVVYLPELNLVDVTQNKPAVQSLIALYSPRITLVGGAPEAYFDAFVSNLPDPIIFDEEARKIRELLHQPVEATLS